MIAARLTWLCLMASVVCLVGSLGSALTGEGLAALRLLIGASIFSLSGCVFCLIALLVLRGPQ